MPRKEFHLALSLHEHEHEDVGGTGIIEDLHSIWQPAGRPAAEPLRLPRRLMLHDLIGTAAHAKSML